MATNRPQGFYPTYRVRRSWSASTATGETALVFETLEGSIIAIELPVAAIGVLSKQLTELALFRSRGAGHA